MVQTIIVILLFAAALGYLGRMVYRQFHASRQGCAGECKCDSHKDTKTLSLTKVNSKI